VNDRFGCLFSRNTQFALSLKSTVEVETSVLRVNRRQVHCPVRTDSRRNAIAAYTEYR